VTVVRGTILVLLALLALAAGCGDEPPSAEEAWATDLCAAAAVWRATLEEVALELRTSPSLGIETVREGIDESLEATETLAADLRALRPPAGEAGEEAALAADTLATGIEELVADVRDRLGSTSSLQELAGELSDAIEEISRLGGELGSTLEGLRDLDGGQELLNAIEANEDCQIVQSGS
jgi:hypothetical protein